WRWTSTRTASPFRRSDMSTAPDAPFGLIACPQAPADSRFGRGKHGRWTRRKEESQGGGRTGGVVVLADRHGGGCRLWHPRTDATQLDARPPIPAAIP